MKLVRVVPLLLLVLVLVPSQAAASPVKCTGDELTPDGRVFPEPRVSTQFLRFDEFRCGVDLLQRRHPELTGGAGIYRDNGAHGPFIHIDVRGNPARW